MTDKQILEISNYESDLKYVLYKTIAKIKKI